MLKICSSSDKLHLFQHLPRYKMPWEEISPSNTNAFLEDLEDKGLDSQDFWINICPNSPSASGYSDSALYDLLLRLQALADMNRIDIFIWCLTRDEVYEVQFGRQTPLNKIAYLED